MFRRRSYVIVAALAFGLLSIAPLFASGSQQATQAAQVKQINVWMIHSPLQKLTEAFNQAGSNFAKESDITVNYVRIPTENFHQKLVTAVSAGQYPDMVIWNTSPGVEFSQTGAVHEMGDVLAKVGKDRFPPDALKMFQYPLGKQWEIPFLARLAGFHYRKDWLTAAGIDPNPVKDANGNLYVKAYDTWNDMLVTSKKLTGNGRYGAGFQYDRKGFGDSAAFAFSVMTSFGGHFLDPKTGKVALDSPETIAAFTYLKKLYDSGVMPPGVATWNGYDNNLYFTNGTVGLIFNSNSVIPNLKPTDKLKRDEIGITVPMRGPDGRKMSASPDTITLFNTKALSGAEAYAEYLLEKSTQLTLFKTMGVGYYGPLLLDVVNSPEFASLDEQDRMFVEANKYIIGLGWPGAANPKLVTAYDSFILDDALSRLAVDHWTPQRTVQEMTKKLTDIVEH